MLLLALWVLGWCPWCPTAAGVSGGVIQVGTVLGTGAELAAATDGTACIVFIWCRSTPPVPLELGCAAVGVATSDGGPEPPESMVASAGKATEVGSLADMTPGTAKGPTDDEVLMLRAGLAGRAGPKAAAMVCCRGSDGAMGVTGVAFGVVCCETAVLSVEMRTLCCGEILPS
jgi:hypothetical protein